MRDLLSLFPSERCYLGLKDTEPAAAAPQPPRRVMDVHLDALQIAPLKMGGQADLGQSAAYFFVRKTAVLLRVNKIRALHC